MSLTTKILRVCLAISVIALITAVVAAIVAVNGGERSFSEFILPIFTTLTGTACVLIALNVSNKKNSDK